MGFSRDNILKQNILMTVVLIFGIHLAILTDTEKEMSMQYFFFFSFLLEMKKNAMQANFP